MFQVFTAYASEALCCLLSNIPKSELDLGAGLNCQGLGQGDSEVGPLLLPAYLIGLL